MKNKLCLSDKKLMKTLITELKMIRRDNRGKKKKGGIV